MDKERGGLPVLDFADTEAWETWLATHGGKAAGVWLKIAKAGNAASSLTKAQAIDGALCHGWIDGQIDKWDQAWFLTRFTPRKRTSKWSENNRKRAEQLVADGRVAPAGLTEIEAAKADGRWDTAYAPASTAAEPEDLRAALDAEPAARTFFDTLTGVNRYAILYRVQTAKKPETRAARIAKFVEMCARGETVH
ncbi:YdeI/OmpD-associated family protein [Sphingomonas asaccharolytica]|uniref:YdeI/OmpD-associated family protein n=1 Tax=Sphingomonas asaccharolytica TaxID=40681 RepID=UPI00082AF579|nr:YdeI/OmpD-associated family protein [Sphingomonas asaccharolytica]